MQRYEAKIVSLLIIFVCILGAMLLPIRVAGAIARRGERGQQILGGVSCFSGGIFLATYLLDMAPEVRTLLEDTLLRPNHIDYPLPELIIGAGFFFILIVELVVTTISRRRQHVMKTRQQLKENKVDVVEMGTTAEDADTKNSSLASGEAETEAHLTGTDSTKKESARINAEIVEMSSQDAIKEVDSTTIDNSNIGSVGSNRDLTHNASYDNRAFESPTEYTDPSSKPSGNEAVKREAADDECDQGHHHATRSIILVLALSLDSVFEGMAVGLRTTMLGVWNLTIAIVAHEVVIAFGMGMQLLKHQTRRTVIIVAIVYSVMSPLGGAIGTLLMESQGRSTNMDLANGVLQVGGVYTWVAM